MAGARGMTAGIARKHPRPGPLPQAEAPSPQPSPASGRGRKTTGVAPMCSLAPRERGEGWGEGRPRFAHNARMAFEYGHLIERFGYAATFAGTLIEGESLLILSGLAAHRGYLSLPLVILVGAVGGAIGDMAFFLLGRHYGGDLLTRFPRFAPAAGRVHAMIERHPAFAILAVRFMYGLRTAGPAIIGTTRIALAEYAVLNALGAATWSVCWAGAGYVLGHAAERLLGDLAHVERELFGAAIVAIVVGVVALHVWRSRRTRGN